MIDQAGNKQDYETEFVPRMGERIVLSFGNYRENNVREHFFRVKDVEYHLQNRSDIQARILIEEETNAERWPD